jgi:hypothetical protein
LFPDEIAEIGKGKEVRRAIPTQVVLADAPPSCLLFQDTVTSTITVDMSISAAKSLRFNPRRNKTVVIHIRASVPVIK